MYEDGIVHDILCDNLSGRHYHLELHCVPCNIKVSLVLSFSVISKNNSCNEPNFSYHLPHL